MSDASDVRARLLAALEAGYGPWAEVRKVVMSPARFEQLRADVPAGSGPFSRMLGIEVEVSPVADERVAVLD
jgi:hypothetical protein